MKKKLIKSALVNINQLVIQYETIASRYKLADDVTEGIIMLLGYGASAMLTLKPDIQRVLVSATLMTTLSTVITTIKRTSNMKQKWNRIHAKAHHLRGIYRDTLVVMAKNHLSSVDLDNILTNLYHEITIATDSTELIGGFTPVLKGDSLIDIQRNTSNGSEVSIAEFRSPLQEPLQTPWNSRVSVMVRDDEVTFVDDVVN